LGKAVVWVGVWSFVVLMQGEGGDEYGVGGGRGEGGCLVDRRKWGVGDGRWKMEDEGRWKLEVGRWDIENGLLIKAF